MNAVDMAAFIAPKSDQLNADDLIGGPRTITIAKVSASEGTPEQPINIFFEGDDGKPYKPCKSMRRVMVAVWGADASKYVGRSMTLYRDPGVQFGGMQVGGIRISHMTNIDEKKTMALTATRAKRAPFTVQPLKLEQHVPADDAAAKWANAYVGKLATLTTLDAVEAFEAEKAAKLAELESARPELHANVTARLAARKAELAPAQQPAASPLSEILAKIAGAASTREVDAIDKDTELDRDFMSPDECDELDAALAKRREELREPAGAK